MGRKRKITPKTCEFCKTEFEAKSKSAKYCTDNCRQDAYLLRKKDNETKDLKTELEQMNKVYRGLMILVKNELKSVPSQDEMNDLIEKGDVNKDLLGAITLTKGKIILLEDKLHKLLH